MAFSHEFTMSGVWARCHLLTFCVRTSMCSHGWVGEGLNVSEVRTLGDNLTSPQQPANNTVYEALTPPHQSAHSNPPQWCASNESGIVRTSLPSTVWKSYQGRTDYSRKKVLLKFLRAAEKMGLLMHFKGSMSSSHFHVFSLTWVIMKKLFIDPQKAALALSLQPPLKNCVLASC